jgi:hypothetical protein
MTQAKKFKPTKSRSTEWQVGQPLVFPVRRIQNNIDRLMHEAVEEGLRGPFKSKRSKSKKK